MFKNFKIKNTLLTLLILSISVFSITPIKASDDILPISSSKKSSYVYRFWSDVFHGHFFTSSFSEANKVKTTDSNWKYEGVAFSAYNISQANTIPVYRFWSDVFKGHFYTADESEMIRVRDTDKNWKYETIAFYVYPKDYSQKSATVYRFWSPIFLHHFYTADESEMTKVRNTDTNWDFEGPAFRVPIETDLNIKDTIKTGIIDEIIEINDSSISISKPINSSDNDISAPADNYRLISTKVSLSNIGENPLNFQEDNFSLLDKDTDISYLPTTNVVEPGLESGTLQPGESIEGYITFEIPKTSTNLTLQYASDNMKTNNNQINIDFDFQAKVIVVNSEKKNNNFSGEEISGIVQNNTDNPVRYVKITADFFDKQGEKVGSNYTYAEDAEKEFLSTGEQATFRIWTIHDVEFNSYTLDVTWSTT